MINRIFHILNPPTDCLGILLKQWTSLHPDVTGRHLTSLEVTGPDKLTLESYAKEDLCIEEHKRGKIFLSIIEAETLLRWKWLHLSASHTWKFGYCALTSRNLPL